VNSKEKKDGDKGKFWEDAKMNALGENKRHIQYYILHWGHKDIVWTVSFDKKKAHSTMGSKGKS
jgi:hypothetical protein